MHFLKTLTFLGISMQSLYAFAPASKLLSVNNSVITFISDAPLEKIVATSNSLKGGIDTSTNAFSFRIPIVSFEGFNSKLQKEHFSENYLETDKFPNASFSGKIIETIVYKKHGTYEVRAKGTLNMHGVDQERIIKCTLTINNNEYIIKGSFSVLLSDHKINIPKIVNQKIAKTVQVNIKVSLKP